MNTASPFSPDENGEGSNRCDGCGESHAPSELFPVWDGSIQVCAECFAAATAMLFTRKDSPSTTREAARPMRSPDNVTAVSIPKSPE